MVGMRPRSEIEFTFHDEATNETVVLYGQVDGHALLPPASSNLTVQHIRKGSVEDEEYDGPGALAFVVAVIIVYGISMFLLVATLLRRKSYHKSLDVEVDRYIKGMEAARVEAKMESVLRTRLRWPGNFIHFNAGRHEGYDANPSSQEESEESGGESNSDISHDDSDSSSYTEMPATTMTLDISNRSNSQDNSDDNKDITEVEYPPGFNRNQRRRVSMFPTEERARKSTKERKKSRISERRKGRAAIVLDMDHNDSDTSYVELPATTKEDFYHGSLAKVGGKKVVMKEDDERGGVEIIPESDDEDGRDVLGLDKLAPVHGESAITSKYVADYDVTNMDAETGCGLEVNPHTPLETIFSTSETAQQTLTSHELTPVIFVEDEKVSGHERHIKKKQNHQQKPQKSQAIMTPCTRAPVCLSSANLAPLTKQTSKQSKRHRKKRKTNTPVVYEPDWQHRRTAATTAEHPRQESPIRDKLRYAHSPGRQRRTGLVETDIDQLLKL